MKIQVSKEAAAELEEAVAWYEEEEQGLDVQLIAAFEHAIQLLREPNPPLTPVTGKAASRGARKLILHRFPFSLIVFQSRQAIAVVGFRPSRQEAWLLVRARALLMPLIWRERESYRLSRGFPET